MPPSRALSGGRLGRASIFTVLAGCAVAYDPQPVAHVVPLSDTAFDTVLEVLRERYRRLEVADRGGFRLQTAWVPIQHGDVPGHQRASVYRDESGRLQLVVEVRYLSMGLTGRPHETAIAGDPRAEAELAGVLAEALRH